MRDDECDVGVDVNVAVNVDVDVAVDVDVTSRSRVDVDARAPRTAPAVRAKSQLFPADHPPRRIRTLWSAVG